MESRQGERRGPGSHPHGPSRSPHRRRGQLEMKGPASRFAYGTQGLQARGASKDAVGALLPELAYGIPGPSPARRFVPLAGTAVFEGCGFLFVPSMRWHVAYPSPFRRPAASRIRPGNGCSVEYAIRGPIRHPTQAAILLQDGKASRTVRRRRGGAARREGHAGAFRRNGMTRDGNGRNGGQPRCPLSVSVLREAAAAAFRT